MDFIFPVPSTLIKELAQSHEVTHVSELAQSHEVTGVSESGGGSKCLYLEFLVFYLVRGCILLVFLKFLIKAP